MSHRETGAEPRLRAAKQPRNYSTGHWGDRALFQRFKTRFILALVFLVGVCLLFTLHDMSGIILVVYAWGRFRNSRSSGRLRQL